MYNEQLNKNKGHNVQNYRLDKVECPKFKTVNPVLITRVYETSTSSLGNIEITMHVTPLTHTGVKESV